MAKSEEWHSTLTKGALTCLDSTRAAVKPTLFGASRPSKVADCQGWPLAARFEGTVE